MRTPKSEEVAIERVKRWFSQPGNDKWLLIFDNYDNPDFCEAQLPTLNGFDIRRFFPQSSQGNIIITTRSKRLFFSQQLHLRKLKDFTTGVSILSQRSQRDLSQDPEASDLAQRLDGLPLALATAGAFLASTTMSCTEYLVLYESMWKQLFHLEVGKLDDYPRRTLSTTWSLSFNHVREQNEDIAKLLEFMAYLGPRDIWYELLKAGASTEVPWLAHVTQNQILFQQAMSKLHECCLVDVAGTSHQLHPCVHDWLVQMLPEPPEKASFVAALRCIDGSRSDLPWDQVCRLSDHVNQLSSPHLAAAWDSYSDLEEVDSAVSAIIQLLMDLGLYRQVEASSTVALHGCEKALGPRNISTLGKMLNLTCGHHNSHNFDQAEFYSLEILNRLSQTDTIDGKPVSKILEDLDARYSDGDLMSEAERKMAFVVVSNLNTTYISRQKHTEAREAQLWMLQKLEKFPEVDERLLVCILSTILMTIVSGHLGSDVVVKPDVRDHYFSQAWAQADRPMELDTAYAMSGLSFVGRWYLCEEDTSAAEVILTRAWRGTKRMFGPTHHYTRCRYLDLSILYSATGRLSTAEEMFAHATAEYEDEANQEFERGKFHAVLQLATSHLANGSLDRAEELCKISHDGWIKIVGPDHLITLNSLHTLAEVYEKQGRHEEAESTIRKFLMGLQTCLSPEQMTRLFGETIDDISEFFPWFDTTPARDTTMVAAQPSFRRNLTKTFQTAILHRFSKRDHLPIWIRILLLRYRTGLAGWKPFR